jgi:hypothetical protein
MNGTHVCAVVLFFFPLLLPFPPVLLALVWHSVLLTRELSVDCTDNRYEGMGGGHAARTL